MNLENTHKYEQARGTKDTPQLTKVPNKHALAAFLMTQCFCEGEFYELLHIFSWKAYFVSHSHSLSDFFLSILPQ